MKTDWAKVQADMHRKAEEIAMKDFDIAGGAARIDFALRFRHERLRLGLSQVALAESLVLSRESIRRYEGGLCEYRIETLCRLAALGADVQYIVTGQRSENLAAAMASAQATLSDEAA